MRRDVQVGALVVAVVALGASVTFAAGRVNSQSSGTSMMGGTGQGSGTSMMGGTGQGSAGSMMGGTMGSMRMVWLTGDGVAVPSIPAARAKAKAAATPAGLHPGEVIRFDNGFYVELKDRGGKAVTEVIVDPRTGAVNTEPGPAMMWNTRFGMMSASGGTNGSVSSTKAQAIATSWLAANRVGTTIAGIDAYPGYFTIDLQRKGVLSGMMSVSSVTGAVWYHSWHGAFIAREDS